MHYVVTPDTIREGLLCSELSFTERFAQGSKMEGRARCTSQVNKKAMTSRMQYENPILFRLHRLLVADMVCLAVSRLELCWKVRET